MYISVQKDISRYSHVRRLAWVRFRFLNVSLKWNISHYKRKQALKFLKISNTGYLALTQQRRRKQNSRFQTTRNELHSRRAWTQNVNLFPASHAQWTFWLFPDLVAFLFLSALSLLEVPIIWCNAFSAVLIVWRISSCFSLDTGRLVDFSSCEGERLETLPSVFVASLPGLVLASPEATSAEATSPKATYEYGLLQSLTVLNPDDL